MHPIVELENVVKEYPLGRVTVRALRQVNLALDRGEFTVVAGPSGSGKTTLLNLVGGIDVPTSGEVRIDGRATSRLSDRALTALRLEKLGFIFQSFNLINVLDVVQNIEFPLLLQGELSRRERRVRVDALVERVGLQEQVRQRPGELSGGQRQRVAIARALVTRPAIVLADEPTANLDSATGTAIIELMREINHTDHTTFIFSTHDPKVMERADRVVPILDGRLEADTHSRSRAAPVEAR
ncbi:MAG: ABC transporter ATP-binding protein [Deltaproteobacteria bacterium]|nr:ABC transporter ATP-binding protein [Deltaproteobacteria bacterium]